MRLSVAMPTLGRETLFATLASLRTQTRLPDEVVVVLQGDRSVAPRIEEAYPGVRVVWQEVKGVARARNAGVRESTGDWIVSIDDDEEAAPDWLANIEKLIDSYPQVEMIGGAVLPPLGVVDDQHMDQLAILEETVINKVNYLHPPVQHPNVHHDFWCGNMAVRRSLFDRIGYFDEELGRGSTFAFGEDVDFAARAISAGVLGLLSPRMIIYHTYGARPLSVNTSMDNVVMNAILLWKAAQQKGLLAPEVEGKLLPYGRKKSSLARVTGGAVFGDQLERLRVFEETQSRLDREYTLEGGCLKKKA